MQRYCTIKYFGYPYIIKQTEKQNAMKKSNTTTEVKLILEYNNGSRYCYYGDTKKECLAKARKQHHKVNSLKKEWEITELETAAL